ncbi:acetyltransferase [Psychroflexus planctonicus]|uniref:Acetyltransferase n=1 Tax=Psychroflexus planctonicus TaxID=1526575 RepID=A0ABQ1SIK9_9FLAO|nr:acetyltransferase [Psychroflexus planctonicus]GGE41854.1 acetyltransferase [Psychroflexus planctonicus]
MRKINLFGASGHAKVIIDIIENNGFDVGQIFDDNSDINSFIGRNVVSIYSKELLDINTTIISIGDNRTRKKIYENLEIKLEKPLIHPSAIVSSNSVIGKGTVIMPNAVVNAGTIIGKNCIINSGAIVEHDCILKDYVHISPSAALAGGVNIGEGAHVGIGAVIIQCVEIGEWSIIGAGAVVSKSLPANCTAVGIPAKPIKFH